MKAEWPLPLCFSLPVSALLQQLQSAAVLVFYRINLLPNATLKITNVTRQDAGSYTCIAKNQFGTASTTGRLLITGESGMQTLVFFRASCQELTRSFSSTSVHTCSESVSASLIFRNGAECVIVQPKGSKYTVSLWKCRTILASALTLEGLGSLRVSSWRELVLFSSSSLIRQSIIDVLAA